MRSTLVPLALIAVVGSASLAMASTTATGIIKSLDMKDHSITLADGATYEHVERDAESRDDTMDRA